LHRFSRCASKPPSRTICMRCAGIGSQASVSPVVKFWISQFPHSPSVNRHRVSVLLAGIREPATEVGGRCGRKGRRRIQRRVPRRRDASAPRAPAARGAGAKFRPATTMSPGRTDGANDGSMFRGSAWQFPRSRASCSGPGRAVRIDVVAEYPGPHASISADRTRGRRPPTAATVYGEAR